MTLLGATTPGQSATLHSPKLQHYFTLTIRLFSFIPRTLDGGTGYPSADMQSVYSNVLADRGLTILI